MVKDDKRGHRSRWWILPSAAGLALIMTAILLWSSGPGNPGTPIAQAQLDTATPTATATPTRTPTVTPTVNPECDLKVTKTDSPDPVAPDDQITYTITVKNDADKSGSCDGFEVTDEIPDNTECVSIDVINDDAADVDADEGAVECDDADEGDEVGWDSTDDLGDGDSVTLKLVVELTSGADDGDTISNTACATSGDDKQGDCDTQKTKVDEDATTKTPTPAPTATRAPTVIAPPPPPPPVAPPPVVAPPPTTLIAPLTGSGAESASGGSLPLALALGLTGGCLLLLGGVALLRRPR